MKIAVASSDESKVDLHFGHAREFSIYDFDEEKTTFLERRHVKLNPDEKHQWKKSLDVIEDCDVVICVQAGMNAKFGLEQKGIKLVEDEGTVKEVLDRYIKHYNFMKKPI
jgi:predicted Fe-Mo cluster-binding NifX family protein